MPKTVVGFYDKVSQARDAVRDLDSAGFNRNEINFVANAAAEQADYKPYFNEQGRYREDYDGGDLTPGEGAASGAGIGATIGGLGGLLMGLGLLAVPGVGPALAAGPIASTLVGAGIGAVSGGLAGALVNSGVPEDQAHVYAEGVRRGGSLVSLTVDDARVDEAESVLNKHNPSDIDERAATWRDSGWTGYDPDADPYTRDEVIAERQRYA